MKKKRSNPSQLRDGARGRGRVDIRARDALVGVRRLHGVHEQVPAVLLEHDVLHRESTVVGVAERRDVDRSERATTRFGGRSTDEPLVAASRAGAADTVEGPRRGRARAREGAALGGFHPPGVEQVDVADARAHGGSALTGGDLRGASRRIRPVLLCVFHRSRALVRLRRPPRRRVLTPRRPRVSSSSSPPPRPTATSCPA